MTPDRDNPGSADVDPEEILEDVVAGPGPSGTWKKWLIRIAGLGLAVAALVWCALALAESWDSVSHALATADIGLIVAGGAVAVGVPVGQAFGWQRVLARLGRIRVSFGRAVTWYLGGELGKYLPGTVWAVIGRGELARRDGVPRGLAYTSTLVAMAMLVVSAGVTAALLVPFQLVGGAVAGWGWLLVAAIPGSLLLLWPPVNRIAFGVLTRLTRGRVTIAPLSVRAMADIAYASIPGWLATGVMSVLVTRALGFDIHPVSVALAAVVAWIAGFLAVPVPAGLGIREGVFVLMAGMDPGAAVAVAAVARLLQTAVDLAGGAVSLLVLRRSGTLRP